MRNVLMLPFTALKVELETSKIVLRTYSLYFIEDSNPASIVNKHKGFKPWNMSYCCHPRLDKWLQELFCEPTPRIVYLIQPKVLS